MWIWLGPLPAKNGPKGSQELPLVWPIRYFMPWVGSAHLPSFNAGHHPMRTFTPVILHWHQVLTTCLQALVFFYSVCLECSSCGYHIFQKLVQCHALCEACPISLSQAHLCFLLFAFTECPYIPLSQVSHRTAVMGMGSCRACILNYFESPVLGAP